jgi:restriction endonuclease
MKLKFKKQTYQTNAVDAVADCFAGQPKREGLNYRVDPGRSVNAGGQAAAEWSMSTILAARRQLSWPVEAGNELNGLLS